MKLIREPLVHFLAIGIGLFVLYEFVAPAEADAQESRSDVQL